ncbi:MAG: hypothetical protein JO283_05525, partial [Bradyrhizobium sp.]|nr:hypothetical protein [Bradyrhizobium sp.]
MADYYPLIARAIAGLDPNAPGESRRALYEKARAALIAQLRSVQPPLSESEITRERLSLEEAVRKVESEAAQRARDASRRAIARPGADATAGVQGASAAPRPRPSPSPSRNDRPPLGQEDGPPLGPERQAAPDQQRPQRAEAPPRPQSSSSPPQVGMPDQRGPERAGAPPTSRGADNGLGQSPRMRGFRDTAADGDDLGRGATQASRAPRKTNANVPSPPPEFDRLEPGMEAPGDDFEAHTSYDEAEEEEAERQPFEPPGRIPTEEEREGKRFFAGALFPFKTAIAIGIVLILAGAAMLWGRSVVSTVSGLFRSQPVEAPRDALAPLAKPKITDRVGQPSDQVAPAAQRVVLYDEDPNDPKGKQYVGTVVWRTEPIKAS